MSTYQCRSTQGCPVLKQEGFGVLCTAETALGANEGLQESKKPHKNKRQLTKKSFLSWSSNTQGRMWPGKGRAVWVPWEQETSTACGKLCWDALRVCLAQEGSGTSCWVEMWSDGSGESPGGGARLGFTAPQSLTSLPGALTAVQLFLEISKEQAAMEFLCFYIWLDVHFSDFQEKAWKGQGGNLPVPALYPNRRNAIEKSCQG